MPVFICNQHQLVFLIISKYCFALNNFHPYPRTVAFHDNFLRFKKWKQNYLMCVYIVKSKRHLWTKCSRNCHWILKEIYKSTKVLLCSQHKTIMVDNLKGNIHHFKTINWKCSTFFMLKLKRTKSSSFCIMHFVLSAFILQTQGAQFYRLVRADRHFFRIYSTVCFFLVLQKSSLNWNKILLFQGIPNDSFWYLFHHWPVNVLDSCMYRLTCFE